MKDAYYFPHDSNALDDPKISALISKYGFQGYGWFWAIVELLRNQPDYRYPINKYTFDTFARRLLCDRNTVVEYINDCCHEFADSNSALFCMDDEYIWSNSLLKRMSPIDIKRQKARESVRARWGNERNTNVIQTYNDSNTSKVKESKGKESKEEETQQQQESKIFTFFNKNISLITPFQAESISQFLNDGVECEMILEILQDSIGKSESWSWINKVLNNCFDAGVKTLLQYQDGKRKRNKQQITSQEDNTIDYMDLVKEKRQRRAGNGTEAV